MSRYASLYCDKCKNRAPVWWNHGHRALSAFLKYLDIVEEFNAALAILAKNDFEVEIGRIYGAETSGDWIGWVGQHAACGAVRLYDEYEGSAVAGRICYRCEDETDVAHKALPIGATVPGHKRECGSCPKHPCVCGRKQP